MEAFFFGSSTHSLYGVYHPPAVATFNNQAVLLCGPVAHEAIRLHKALRFIATQLANAGFHVLRFDYRGQGDSAGNMDGVTPACWQEDIVCAIQELRDISMATNISIIGVRMGGLLAATLKSTPVKVSRLVLWDPWVAGEAYQAEIFSAGKPQPDSNDIEFNGFLFPGSFTAGLPEISLMQSTFNLFQQVDLILSQHNDEFELLSEKLKQHENYTCTSSPAVVDWNYVDNESGILWPMSNMQCVLQRMVGPSL
ncbi:alpha/beta fold hydrolase [Simiduia curdlanivorans]|uniref:Alpha/beta fold hydrolase n=1 Tax=Simiduia curdlanivorans TaxID=1492769 RepID=A0ABV8VC79_9GAMM|nr:alpha/beta fold hydrolase [Simiduia curdlanivorans]MDN3638480.1 alpha/beta fold hydrolase [Simiduia curdlanivorans]